MLRLVIDKYDVVLKIQKDLILQSKEDRRAYLYVEEGNELRLFYFKNKSDLYDLYRKCVNRDSTVLSLINEYCDSCKEIFEFLVDETILSYRNRQGVL